ncbi:MAG TPA: hypothetical protein VM580_26785 [Labilithrix sp.]|nr:hypothetical protein [Labilithrix sp.]
MRRYVGALVFLLMPTAACTLFIDMSELSTRAGSAEAAAPEDASATDADLPVDSGDGGDANGADADASAGDAGGTITLFDDFDRDDSPDIGNGWIEKAPTDSFELKSGSVLFVNASDTDYTEPIVYRPAEEDVLDVEVSVDIQVAGSIGYPHVVARLQSETGHLPGEFTAYYAYFDDSSPETFSLTRHNGPDEIYLAGGYMVTPLIVGEWYRLTLRVRGTNPVLLTATTTQVTTGAEIGRIEWVDDDPARITTAGSVGFGAAYEAGTQCDNFTRRIY